MKFTGTFYLRNNNNIIIETVIAENEHDIEVMKENVNELKSVLNTAFVEGLEGRVSFGRVQMRFQEIAAYYFTEEV